MRCMVAAHPLRLMTTFAMSIGETSDDNLKGFMKAWPSQSPEPSAVAATGSAVRPTPQVGGGSLHV
jgi:hypothetical protein